MQYSCISYRRKTWQVSRDICGVSNLTWVDSYVHIRDYVQLYEKSGGSVVDSSTRDWGVAGSSLVGATALRHRAKLYFLCFELVKPMKTQHDWKTNDWDVKNQIKQNYSGTVWFLILSILGIHVTSTMVGLHRGLHCSKRLKHPSVTVIYLTLEFYPLKYTIV